MENLVLKFRLTVMVFLFSLLITSCEDDLKNESNNLNALIGTWVRESDNNTIKFEKATNSNELIFTSNSFGFYVYTLIFSENKATSKIESVKYFNYILIENNNILIISNETMVVPNILNSTLNGNYFKQ